MAEDYVGVQTDPAGGKSIDAEKVPSAAAPLGFTYRQRVVLDGERFTALLDMTTKVYQELRCLRAILNEMAGTEVTPNNIADESEEL